MKKFIVSIVLLSYLAVSTGVMVNFHYCMNRLDSTHLFAAKSDKCGKCGMHTGSSKGCCRDEVQLVKMSDDQKTVAKIVFSLPAIDAVTQTPSSYLALSFYNTPGEGFYTTHSPPLLSDQESYIQNCVFRI